MSLKSFFLALTLSLALPTFAQDAGGLQNRVNLEDVDIQGEGRGAGNMFQNRNRFDLDERVKVRKSFMKELEENIPVGLDKLPAKALN